MSSISYRQSFAIFCCALPFAATAQSSHSVPQLDNVVVTASRSAQLASEVVGDVTVIDRQELERAGQTSIAEVLAKQPGIQFNNSGGPQTITSIFTRGTNSNQTLVLVDGMRVNSSANGLTNWSAIDPALIERVEVLRGSASSLYGSDAIGGVINIITRKPDGDRPLSVWGNMGYGTHDTFKSSVGLSGAQDGWDYAFSSFMAHSDGFNATTPDAPFGSYNRDRDGYEQHGYSGSLGYEWKTGQHIGISMLNSYSNAQYDAGSLGDARTLTRQQAYALTSTNQITSAWESVLRFGLSKDFREERVDGYDDIGTLQRHWSWKNTFTLNENHQLSTVLERLEERLQGTLDYDIDYRNTNSAGLIYQGRFDALRTQASFRNDNISGYGSKQTGSLGADYDLTQNWTVGLAGSTGFKAPDFNDLYWPADPFWGGGGNPDLKPEKSRNLEAHISFANDTSSASLTVYQNKIRDLITYDASVGVPNNINRAKIRGITVSADHRFSNTRVYANADFMEPKDDETGNQLVRRARHVYNLGVSHRMNAWDLGAEYQFVGKRYDDVANERRMGGYSLFNLTAAYDFTKNVGVQVRWNNVFDKDYTTVYGYSTPGSNIFVNLSFRM